MPQLESCRCCLEKIERQFLFPLEFSYQDSTIIELIQEITNIEIKLTEGFPQKICNTCLEKFSEAKKVKTLFLKSDQHLHGLSQTPDSFKEIENERAEAEESYTFRKPRRSNAKQIAIEFLEDLKDQDLTDDVNDEDFVDGVFQCEVCPKKVFKSRCALDKHNKKHQQRDDPPLHVCQNCGKKFWERNTIVKHKCIMFKSVCNYCQVEFKSKRLLLDHMDEVHRDPNDRKFHCPVENCKTLSISGRHFFHHLAAHFNKKEFICSLCGKKHTNYLLHKAHKSVHHSGKLYSCDVCGGTFKTLTAVKRHLKSRHLNLRIYCDQCSATYSTIGALNKHKMNTHDMESSYQCSYCSAKFAFQSEWKSHEARHTQNPSFRGRKRRSMNF